jgi:hypothetical protein
MSNRTTGNPPSRRLRPRFTLTTLMLVSLCCAVTAAGGRYLVQGLSGEATGRATFVIAILLLPMAILIGVHLLHRVVLWLEQQKRRRR